MNPVYDNSVPFYPTIPNQNPVNTFFPNHNGQYSRDTYAPHFQNAAYSNPPPVNATYPPNFGYNSHRYFPSSNQRSVYPNLGINTNVTPMYTNSHQNPVNPGYYPNTNSGIPCGCANHNPVNSNHAPSYPRLVHIGNLIYPLPNSTEFNSANGNHWAGNQNNTYYAPANNGAGNSTNANWNYHRNFNQNASSYTQSAHNRQAGHHAASNTAWIPYSSQNTFQPIPDDENNDNLSDFSFDPLSSASELNLLGSTPDHNFALPNAFSVNSSPSTLEGCGNHTDINQNSENVNCNQATDANVSSLGRRICSDVQEEPIPSISLGANEVLVKCNNSDPVKNDSTTTAGQSANTSAPVSTLNTPVVKNGTETVAESTGLNQVINPRMVNVDFQNIEASEKDQTLQDSIFQDTIVAKSIDTSALKTTVSSTDLEVANITTRSTSVNPPSSGLSLKSKETVANLDHTYVNDCQSIMNAEHIQALNNNTEEPNNNSQLKPQNFASSTAEPNDEKHSPKCAADKLNLPTRISSNFRRLLIRYLNRLDDVNTTIDSDSDYLNIDDEVINSFVASLNSENRRLLQQNPNKIGMGNLPKVTENTGNENEEDVSNIEKNKVKHDDLKRNQENVSNTENKEAKHNGDSEIDLKENEENGTYTEKNEQEQNEDREPEIEQCNVLLESCADQEELPTSKEDSSESQQHLNEYLSADDVDVINTNLDTIEVTVGDVLNSSVEEEFFEEDEPLDLAKEKEKIPEPEPEAKSRYFEVSQFLPHGNMYWHHLDVESLEDNAGTAAQSVDVLVELPLNLTCKNRSNTGESQTEDIAPNHPSVSVKEDSSLTCDAKATNREATKKKLSADLMKKMLFAKIIAVPSGSEPPTKKIRMKPGESIILVKTNEPKK